jgi:hypothetical protein
MMFPPRIFMFVARQLVLSNARLTWWSILAAGL